LTVLAGFRPRLILIDIQLPGIDGLALTRWLKSAGCDGYLPKLIDTRTFPRTVARYLAGDDAA
jgi:CheY-like chemotaxis protein